MIRQLLKKLFYVFWLLPGFLLWASFPPMGEKMDCLFALAPLLWLARRGSVKNNLKAWAANGFLFWFATLSWMPAIVKNGGPWPLVVLGWGALAAYCTLYFVAFGWLAASYWGWARERTYRWRLAGLFVVEPVLWAGLELLRSRLFGGFAWNQLGVAPINAGFGAPAALGGVYLVSAFVVLVNGTIASIAERMWRPSASGIPNWARSVETFLPFLVIWGSFALADRVNSAVPAAQDRAEIGIGFLQRNFPSVFERDREEDPTEAYTRLTANLKHLKPDLLIAPESALCEFGPVDSLRAARWAEWLREQTGAYAVLAGGSRRSEGREYNSAGLFTAMKTEVYDKVHLVPFGEFIPGDKLMPILQKLAPVGSCTPGELTALSVSKDLRLGVGICFEDTDSAQIRGLVAKKSANLLVFITNDSWFSRSNEAVQHAWQAVARAIETGVPVVRVGNSGVTGTVLPDGKASWLCDGDGRPLVDAAASMYDRVSVGPVRGTLYLRWGDIPLFLAFLLLITVMGVVKYRHDYEKRRKLSL